MLILQYSHLTVIADPTPLAVLAAAAAIDEKEDDDDEEEETRAHTQHAQQQAQLLQTRQQQQQEHEEAQEERERRGLPAQGQPEPDLQAGAPVLNPRMPVRAAAQRDEVAVLLENLPPAKYLEVGLNGDRNPLRALLATDAALRAAMEAEVKNRSIAYEDPSAARGFL